MNEVFKIARILNMETVVINAGSQKGLCPGDILEIFEDPDPVFDPETKEQLGTLPQRKALIEIIEVAEKLSVCENYQKNNSFFDKFKYTVTPDDLNVRNEQIKPLPIDSQPISVGDKVRLVRRAPRKKE